MSALDFSRSTKWKMNVTYESTLDMFIYTDSTSMEIKTILTLNIQLLRNVF